MLTMITQIIAHVASLPRYSFHIGLVGILKTKAPVTDFTNNLADQSRFILIQHNIIIAIEAFCFYAKSPRDV